MKNEKNKRRHKDKKKRHESEWSGEYTEKALWEWYHEQTGEGYGPDYSELKQGEWYNSKGKGRGINAQRRTVTRIPSPSPRLAIADGRPGDSSNTES